MPLPLVIEQTARWYWFAAPLGGLPLALLLYGVVRGWILNREAPRPGPLAGMLLLVLAGLWFVALPLGWQTRFDKDGITVKAPLDLFISTPGHIDWKDLDRISIADTATRGGSIYWIEFHDGRGTTLELQNLHAYPASFWPALVAAIESNAPQARFEAGKAEWLRLLKERTDPESAPFTALRGYVVRDGKGDVLR